MTIMLPPPFVTEAIPGLSAGIGQAAQGIAGGVSRRNDIAYTLAQQEQERRRQAAEMAKLAEVFRALQQGGGQVAGPSSGQVGMPGPSPGAPSGTPPGDAAGLGSAQPAGPGQIDAMGFLNALLSAGIQDPATLTAGLGLMGQVMPPMRERQEKWETVEGEGGIYQVNPVTGETRNLGISPKTKTESVSQLGKLLKERNALSASGDKSMIPYYDAAIERAVTGTGMEISTNPDGTVSVKTGIKSTGGVTQKTQAAIESDILKTGAGLQQISNVEKMFRPEFLQLGEKWNSFVSRNKEKLGFSLSEEEKAALSEFASFRRGAQENLNRYIKEITGAQMSEKEVKRLMLAMPTPGTGLFDGDSPTEFRSKLRGVRKTLQFSAARYFFAKNHGLDPVAFFDVIAPEDMRKIMASRAKAIATAEKKKNPEIGEKELYNSVKSTMAEEFGGWNND